jgi:hypothetical protein
MSKHVQKFPGLYAGAKAAGISYTTAFLRVTKLGWSVERAISEPPRKKTSTRTLEDRRAYYAATREAREAKRQTRIAKRRNAHRVADDTSPPHIRVLRATLCNEFIKTGNINEAICAQLKDYANEHRSVKEHPTRVPDEPAVDGPRRSVQRVGDDSGRDDLQIDRSAAGRIGNFLRSL